MNRFIKFIICVIIGFSNVAAAAVFAFPEGHPGVIRINCVIEDKGKVVSYEGHKGPCIAFFDVTTDPGSNLNASIRESLIEKKIVNSTESIKLELYGISVGRSIHDEWRKVTEQDINEFWEHLTGLSHELKGSRNLDRVHIGALNFARYIFKVSYDSPK